MRFWNHDARNTRFFWIFSVLTGILFLVIGFSQGQLAVIWRKAVMICMECIGIG